VTVYPTPRDVVKERDVIVPMRDGVILRVNVYRPPGDGPFPVIMSAHPYGKDNVPRRTRRGWAPSFQFRIMNQSAPFSISDQTSWEAPDPAWWTARGYAVVNADLRGCGTSDGVGTLMSDQEAEDVYDLVEWAAAAPWSSGSIGLLGVSYLAISQYKAAALRPPHLRAICPWEGFTDAYRDFMTPGGVTERGFSVIWQAATRRAARLSEDIAAQRRRHPLRDGWWESLTPDLSRIETPMLVCGSFSDSRLHSQGSFRAFEEVASAERFLYTHRGPKWATFYSEDARRTQLAFFDRYLRGRDVPRPAPVRLEVREARDKVVTVRDEQEWPLARTRWRDLALGADGRLGEPADAPGSETFSLRRGALRFDLTVAEDVELTGPMMLRLWISLHGCDDAALFAGVEKWSGGRYVPFEGSYGYGRDRVATGMHRVSLRELDPERSSAVRPVFTFRTSQPLSEGEVVPLDMALSDSSTQFRAGDSLRLVIAGRFIEPKNPLFGNFPARYASSTTGRCTIHWGDGAGSFLRVPVVDPPPGAS